MLECVQAWNTLPIPSFQHSPLIVACFSCSFLSLWINLFQPSSVPLSFSARFCCLSFLVFNGLSLHLSHSLFVAPCAFSLKCSVCQRDRCCDFYMTFVLHTEILLSAIVFFSFFVSFALQIHQISATSLLMRMFSEESMCPCHWICKCSTVQHLTSRKFNKDPWIFCIVTLALVVSFASYRITIYMDFFFINIIITFIVFIFSFVLLTPSFVFYSRFVSVVYATPLITGNIDAIVAVWPVLQLFPL